MMTSTIARLPKAVRTLIGLSAVLSLAVLLSACGSSGGPTTTIPVSTTAAPPTTVATTTLPPNSPPPCSTGVLGASVSLGGASAGTSYYTVKLVNNGPTTCSFDGYPSLSFFTPSGAGGAGAGSLVAVTVQNSAQTPALVSVAHGVSAEFLLFVHEVPSNGVGCTTIASLNITPPSSKESVTTPASLNVCGGSVTVDPIAAVGAENP